eukprot:TRINITY_DN2202_c0_g1_i1.p1 TRINITY_DN2202_c0_g1~~TRINITY_DN2202_c0_g1_i1.p1  ORF type:complete len:283 (-),score=60.97 TRINITY_DN2202_c0_g1_i1:27-875(-)
MKSTILAVIFLFSVVLSQNPSIDTLSKYVLLSYSGYCSPESIENFSCYWCNISEMDLKVDQVAYFGPSDTLAFLAYDKDTAYVVFRGTVSARILDWITDVQFWLDEYPPQWEGAMVHSGFLRGYKGLAKALLPALEKLVHQNGINRIVLTGHSLGAGMATICAADIALKKLVDNVELYTFGSPRVGNPTFAYYLSKSIESYRVTNKEDIIPHLPQIIWNYRHVATEYWFPKNETQYKVCNGSGEDPTCSESVFLALSTIDHLNYLGYDESVGQYFGCDGANP